MKNTCPQWTKTTFSLLLAGMLCLPLACTRRPAAKKSPEATPTVAKTQPAGDQYLHFNNLKEPEYLDPGMMQGNAEHNLSMALFEGLVEYEAKTMEPVPAAAERWEISPDGLTYTFHLRKSAVWTDGKPVTASDFAYSWERVLNPKTASEYSFALYYIKNGQAYNTGKISDPTQLGIKAIDETTFQVTLENPAPFFLNFLCLFVFRPVPKWAVEQHGTNWTRPENMVSNGPFMLKEWIPHKEILVVKNLKYWDAANVKLAGVRFYPLEDRETALKMYEGGQLDVDWELPSVKIPSLLNHPDLIAAPHLASYFYRFNTTKPPLNDVRVRRALAMAIDRKALCDSYLQHTELPWASMVPAGLPGYMPAPGVEFNTTEAKKLLAEAGYADPSKFPPITILYNTDALHKTAAEVIQQMWKQHLGISVDLLNEEWKSYLKDMTQLNYQVVRSGWIGDYLDPNTFLDLFTSSSSQNNTGWKNPKYDQLIAAAGREPDQVKRLQILRQAEELLIAESPIAPILTYKKFSLVRKNVKGYYPNLQDVHPFKWISLE